MVAFITGASSGFGAATARRFAEDGYRVIAVARRAERIEALKKEFGDLILPLVLDIRNRAAVASAVAGLPGDFSEDYRTDKQCRLILEPGTSLQGAN
jgi:3-hydroxy acid dehydrogenase / malonic semialdehyde reductase